MSVNKQSPVEVLIGAVVAAAIVGMFTVWLVMLVLGSLAHDVSWVPALGFFTVWKILFLVSATGGAWGARNRAHTRMKS